MGSIARGLAVIAFVLVLAYLAVARERRKTRIALARLRLGLVE